MKHLKIALSAMLMMSVASQYSFAQELTIGTQDITDYRDTGTPVKSDETLVKEYEEALKILPAQPENAVKKLENVANRRNEKQIDALVKLGDIYRSGQGKVKRDMGKAIGYYEKASNRGSAEAKLCLGAIYLTGEGNTPNNPKKGIEYLVAAAKGGGETAKTAILNLGYIYKEGAYGVEKNIEQAIFWNKEGVKKLNNSDSMFNLYELYLEKYDQERYDDDLKKAKDYLTMAVKAKHPMAMFLQGKIDYEDPFLRSKAVQMIQEAAAAGCTEAVEWLKDNNIEPMKMSPEKLAGAMRRTNSSASLQNLQSVEQQVKRGNKGNKNNKRATTPVRPVKKK